MEILIMPCNSKLRVDLKDIEGTNKIFVKADNSDNLHES